MSSKDKRKKAKRKINRKIKRGEIGGERAPAMEDIQSTKVNAKLEAHAPSQIEKMKEKIRKSDVVLPEVSNGIIKKVKKAVRETEDKEKLEKRLDEISKELEHTETARELFKHLKEPIKNSRKTVKGTAATEEAKKALGIEKPFSELNAEERAKLNKKREELRSKKIKNLLKKNHIQGKDIYLGIGATHTPLYHDIKNYAEGRKKYKEKKGIEVEREHVIKKDLQKEIKKKLIEKGFSKEEAEKKSSRIRSVFGLDEQIERAHKINGLEKEELERKKKEQKEKKEKYIDENFEKLIRKMASEGIEEGSYRFRLSRIAEQAAEKMAKKK